MYTPKAFAMTDLDDQHAIIRGCDFGIMVSVGDGGPTATHLPFVLDVDGPGNLGRLTGHMARTNPQWQAIATTGEEVLVIFAGPHAYVSPTWYADPERNVPTWNYVTVHAYGQVRMVDEPGAVRSLLDRLSAVHEGKGGWSMDLLSPDLEGRLREAIVAFEIVITRLEGKEKISQNKPAAEQAGVIRGLEAAGEAGLAKRMRARLTA